MEEGGAEIKDLHDVKKAFHKKFEWRLLTVENLWTRFFQVKYIKAGHLAINSSSAMGSQLWKEIINVFPNFYENVYVKARANKVSFWYDKGLKTGPLASNMDMVE